MVFRGEGVGVKYLRIVVEHPPPLIHSSSSRSVSSWYERTRRSLPQICYQAQSEFYFPLPR
jgi:hypothetical protein